MRLIRYYLIKLIDYIGFLQQVHASRLYILQTIPTIPQVNRIYLDELGNIRQLPLWVALTLLTTLEEERTTEEARYLLARSQQEAPSPENRAIIELITTIMVYKFEGKSQREIE